MKTQEDKGIQEKSIRLNVEAAILQGDLGIPPNPVGIVLFAHGSGSGRLSSRNRFVARSLQNDGLATLLFDLLTAEEEEYDLRTMELRFDISFLAMRLSAVTAWLSSRHETRDLPLGYFGASTGAAAALIAATMKPAETVKAIVSRGGRPDLAGRALKDVQAPTLLIVGGNDLQVLKLNKEALAQLNAPKKLEIVPGATHLFEEPGALEAVSGLASQWFREYLA